MRTTFSLMTCQDRIQFHSGVQGIATNKVAHGWLLEELRLEDEENYRRYLRMDTETFQVRLMVLSGILFKIDLMAAIEKDVLTPERY